MKLELKLDRDNRGTYRVTTHVTAKDDHRYEAVVYFNYLEELYSGLELSYEAMECGPTPEALLEAHMKQELDAAVAYLGNDKCRQIRYEVVGEEHLSDRIFGISRGVEVRAAVVNEYHRQLAEKEQQEERE